MLRLRRMLGPLAAIWLCCQAGLFAAAPIVLSASHEQLECQCAHGDHAICPMHHRPAPSPKTCLMRAGDTAGAAVLASLFTLAGVLADTITTISSPPQSPALTPVTAAPSRQPASPDPPPPRA